MPEYTIRELGRQGDGVADGAIFVARVLPGEVIEGEATGGRIDAPRIVKPSEDRVSAPCRHFKTCGGCQLQHASDRFLAEWKVDIVRKALAREGLDAPIRGIETSPPRARRRARFSARRTKSGAMAGFHARGSGTLVDIVDCHLLTPELNAGLALARDLAIAGGSRKGEITVQCNWVRDGLDVVVEGGKRLTEELRTQLPGVISKHAVARLHWEREIVAQTAAPLHKIGVADVPLPPGAFLQATDHGEKVLQACVGEAVAGAQSVADLFAGCGTFALDLAENAPVRAYEGDRSLVDACQASAHASPIRHPVTAHARDLFKDPLIASELNAFEAVVLDPPRAGARAQISELAQSAVPVIAYVSCDPTSFSRDAAELVNSGFRLEWIQVVDQFRWSSHVELAARFMRPVT